MPELPEVQTTVNYLKKKIVGLTIRDFWAVWPRITRQKGGPGFVRREVKGRKILDVRRRAKYIVIDVSGPKSIFIHQKMTGHLLYGKWHLEGKDKWVSQLKGALQDSRNQHIRAVFFLNNGYQVGFSDARRFGKIAVVDDRSVKNLREIRTLGPEPLEISLADFKKLFKKKRGRAKPVLMDPTFIVGIGNIYADEILWDIDIHPLSRIENLNGEDIMRMYKSMNRILKKAIIHKGTSADDYRTPTGDKGDFQNFLKAYQRTGKKCLKPKCSGVIERIVIGARSAHFCNKHQSIK